MGTVVRMREVHFIRHCESESNAGLRTEWPGDIRLTERGRRQAEKLVGCFEADPPDLVVYSRYCRTEETATPLLARFPAVRREVWPVHEFTYLAPAAYRNTNGIERRPAVEAYWERNDPHHVDGEGAESIAMLVERLRDLRARILALDCARTVVVSHGFFLDTLLWYLLFEPRMERLPEMAALRKFVQASAWPNGALLTCRFDGRGEVAIGSRRCEHLSAE